MILMKQSLKKEEYLSKILNDLKIPASAQVCALNSLLENVAPKFSQEETDLVKLTLNSCKYMQKLIETCSSVFKLNFQKIIPKYSSFDIVLLVKEIINELDIILKYNKLKIQISTNNQIMIYADRLLISHVVENIISSCIYSAYQNTIIYINITKTKQEICFEVKSNSPYIEEDILKEIFNKYKNYPSYHNIASGIGLYLSKEIVNAHFGRMIAESLKEEINIFGFYLPLR